MPEGNLQIADVQEKSDAVAGLRNSFRSNLKHIPELICLCSIGHINRCGLNLDERFEVGESGILI